MAEREKRGADIVDGKPFEKGSPRLRRVWFVSVLFGAVGVPVTIVFESGPRFRSTWLALALGAEIALAIGGLILAARLARRETVAIAPTFRVIAFLEAFMLTFVSIFFTQERSIPGTTRCRDTSAFSGICTEATKRSTSPAAVALLVSAAALIFLSLVFAPSSERELSRRIDLEACGVALPISFFFFLAYEAFQDGLSLPAFSSGIAALTLLASYLLARLALTIRYR